jgi:hypothetical protein
MDSIESLYQKYLNNLADDIKKGCVSFSIRTQILLAFYQEVAFRQSAAVADNVTADQLLTYTYQNY